MTLIERPLKILHILDHSLPLHSGYTFRSRNIIHSQANKGWSSVALTSPRHEQSWKGPRQEVEEIDGIRYYRTGPVRDRSLPMDSELRTMSVLARRIGEVVEAERPDLLHAHSPILNAIPALRIGRRHGLPVVYEIRAFWEDAAVDHGTYGQGSWKYRLVKYLETRVCRKADQVVVICMGLMKDLENRGIPSEKMAIVPNGINPEDFKDCVPDIEYKREWGLEGKKVLGFIGSFYRYEGLELLLKAAARLSSKRSDFVLLLVGGGEMEKELRRMAGELGIGDMVVMPGRVPHDRVPGVYAMTDILVYPRKPMRLTELVTPLKPLEAMAMGKALLASDVGGHRELIEDGFNGLLFPAGNIDALSDVMGRLLDDPVLRRKIASRGAAWVRRERTWEKTTSAYSGIYARALNAVGKLGPKEERLRNVSSSGL